MSILQSFTDKIAAIAGAEQFAAAQQAAYQNPTPANYDAARRAYDRLPTSTKAAVEQAGDEVQND